MTFEEKNWIQLIVFWRREIEVIVRWNEMYIQLQILLKETVIDLINLFFCSIDHLQLYRHHREVFKNDVYVRSQIYRFV